MRSLFAVLIASIAMTVCAACSERAAAPVVALPAAPSGAPQIVQHGPKPPLWLSFKPITKGPRLAGITVGPDGAIWAAEYSRGRLLRIDMTGTVTEFRIRTYYANELAVGADGNVYVTGGAGIEKVATDGSSTFYKMSQGTRTAGVTLGPDGNVWFTTNDFIPPLGHGQSEICKITPDGKISRYGLSSGLSAIGVGGLTAGLDGNVWWASGEGGVNGSGIVGNINPTTDIITKYKLGTDHSCSPDAIAQAPGGGLWFACLGYVGRITRHGGITWFSAGAYGGGPDSVVPGLNDDIWFVEHGALGTISETGEVQTFTPPGGPNANDPYDLVVGPDKNIWYTDSSKDTVSVYAIHRLDVVPASLTFPVSGQTQSITVSETAYRGSWTASSSDPSVATVAPQGADGFLVTAVGAGSCTITVSDSMSNTFPVSVTVQSPLAR